MDRVTGKDFASRSEVIASRGIAATAHPLATQIAIDILKEGGSAVDGAIAANAALGLMEPTGCGVGGDLFVIGWDAASRQLYGLNGSGRSPCGLSYEELLTKLKQLGVPTIPKHGMLTVSVPGTVDGWFSLHQRFGTLPIGDLLAPSVRYAEQGFPVTEYIAYLWQESLPALVDEPGAFRSTYTVDGKAPRKGEIFRNPNLARTYRILAEHGRDAFYRGEIATTIDRFMRQNGGWLSLNDLAAHTSEWVTPISTNYRGYDIYELPPNTQGVTALQALNILEGFDLRSSRFGTAETLHLMIEAKKLAFEDRARSYGDPTFAEVPTKRLLSKEYAAKQRKQLDPYLAAKQYNLTSAALGLGDTTYLCVADSEGNMVSLIQSNFRGMGSGVVVPGLGFGFQNRGELFTLEPGHPNVYAPGKRPFHTIIPGFVLLRGGPWLAFGVMGGDMQPQGHVQILTNIIDFDMNLQEAGDAPRWYHEGSSEPTGGVMTEGGYVNLESEFPYETVRGLIARGHRVRSAFGVYGGYQAILRDPETGVYYGASESRKDGAAAGY
jgi:gamma-glutamyltranspeptidase/glutathione hydrolase